MKRRYRLFYEWTVIAFLALCQVVGYSQSEKLVDLLRADACSKYRYKISNPTIATLTIQLDPGDGSPLIHKVLPSGNSIYITSKISLLTTVKAFYSEEHYKAEMQSYEEEINKIIHNAEATDVLMGNIQESIQNSPDVSYTLVEDWYGNDYVLEEDHGFGKLFGGTFAGIYREYLIEEAKKQILFYAKKAVLAEKLYNMSNKSSTASRMIYSDVVNSNNYRLFNPGFIYDFAFVSIIGKAGLNDTWNNRRGAKMTFSFGLPGEIRWGSNSDIFSRFYLDAVYETLKFKLRETGEYFLSASLVEGAGQADMVGLPTNEEIYLRGRRFGGGVKLRTQFGTSIYTSIGGGILYSSNAKLTFDEEIEYFTGGNIRLKENVADDLASLEPKANPYLALEVGFLANRAGEGCRYYAKGASFFIGGQVSKGKFLTEGDPKIFQNIDNKVVPAPFNGSSKWLYNVWGGIGFNF